MTDETNEPAVIRLKHTAHELDGVTLHFYEGEVQVEGGIAEFPADRPEWVQRAYIKGYRLDPDTGDELDWGQISERIERAQEPSADATPVRKTGRKS